MSANGAADNDAAFGLDEAYAVETVEDNRRLYARWAATYDDGFLDTHGYVYHESVVDVLERRHATASSELPVLDIGCGTGVVGIELRRRGHRAVEGVDLSPEMLAVAATKMATDDSPVYRALHEVDLTETIGLPQRGAAALVSAGVFTHGHLDAEPIGRLADLVMEGGAAAIGVNRDHFESLGFAAELERLVAEGRVRDVEYVDMPVYDPEHYVAEEGDPHTVSRVVLFSI